jgi:hypothetical protein
MVMLVKSKAGQAGDAFCRKHFGWVCLRKWPDVSGHSCFNSAASTFTDYMQEMLRKAQHVDSWRREDGPIELILDRIPNL